LKARLPAALLEPRRSLVRLKSDHLVRNSVVYLSGSLLAGGLGYVFHFETGRLLGPSGYAIVAAAIAALYLLTLPVVILQLVAARFTSLAAGTGALATIRPLILRLSGLGLLVASPFLLLLVVFAPAVAAFLKISDDRLVYALVLAGVATLLVTVNRGALQGLRSFFALAGNTLLDTGSRLLFAALFIAVGFGPVGAFAAFIFGPAIAYGHSLFLLRRLSSGGIAAEPIEGLGSYALLAASAGVGVNYLFTADTLLAKHYLGAESAGIYAAASVLARVVYFLGLTVAGVMFPEVATLHARNEAHFHVVDLALLLIGAIGVALIVLYTTLPGVVLLPYGATFAPVTKYLGAFAVALTMLALANLLINYFLSIARARFVAPLLAACVLETLLIALFHSSIWQILDMVLVTFAILSATLAALYVRDRLRLTAITA
jgi:O-antigen/teichoic acid export membrane protein